MNFPATLHLFCRVIDNFGDAGVCWRLARQLAAEHGIEVTLWIDDLASLEKMCAGIDLSSPVQVARDVTIRQWPDAAAPAISFDIPDVVIEAFACELPVAYQTAMAARDVKPVWINLEYLSAESWVEGCHAMPSLHASLPLTKHFFFPGFSDKTGGALIERDLFAQRSDFQKTAEASRDFFSRLGISVPEDGVKISLFCYSQAPVQALLEAMQDHPCPVLCLVPEGVASVTVSAWLRSPASAGASATHGALTLHVIPFMDQTDFDKLLWACDFNFVRGEDSFIRAQLAGRPMAWHIYPQDGNAHWPKLNAFLERYQAAMSDDIRQSVTAFWHAWNSDGDAAAHWPALTAVLPRLAAHAQEWSAQLPRHGDLASNLIQFARKIS